MIAEEMGITLMQIHIHLLESIAKVPEVILGVGIVQIDDGIFSSLDDLVPDYHWVQFLHTHTHTHTKKNKYNLFIKL